MTEHEAWSTVRVAMRELGVTEEDNEAKVRANEQLEALAALLAAREDVGGVETRDPECITEGPDFVAVERPELIVYTTPARRDAVEAAVREAAAMLGLGLGLGPELDIEAEDHHGDDWRDAWKRHYRPQLFGTGQTRLLIRPSWIERRAGDPSCELVLDPGRAFGTGLHESTRLCLEALVRLAGELQPRRVLDLGCGSGILGLAARAIWPDLEVLLADHDPEAVETARENAAHNALEGGLSFMQLSLGADTGARQLEPGELVFANIRPEVLIPAAPTLIAATAPGGTLILSGILEEEGDEVLAAYPGFELQARPREGDWCALILRAPAEPREAGAA
jgi:ribosomal protein L11 methyltransferase